MSRQVWIVAALLFLAAAGVRASALSSPPTRVFDELWYARDGCYRWLHSETTCQLRNFAAPDRNVKRNLAEYGEVTPEHPPLGKLLIGAPVKVFGFGPRAWRLAPLIAGSLTVLLLFALVLLSTRSLGVAAGSGLLLAVDFPLFVHSRLAMLDVFLCLFTFAAFVFCYLDRAQITARAAGGDAHQWWRLAAGVAAGAAAASKPSGGSVALAVIALVAYWEIAERRRAGNGPGGLAAAAGSVGLLLVAVPLAVYAATYIGLVDGSLLALPWSEGSWVREWIERQEHMFSLHAGKSSTLDSPWVLPMTTDPQAYFFEQGGGQVRQILLFGNPVLWWAGFAAIVYAAVRWTRDRGSAIAPVIVVGFLAAYAPWLSATLTKTVAFLFYALPVAPFLYLALAHAYCDLPRTRAVCAGGVAAIVASVAAFAFYLPILSARPLSEDAWRPRACSAQTLWLDPEPECGLYHQPRRAAARAGRP